MLVVAQPMPHATRPARNQRPFNWQTSGDPPSPCNCTFGNQLENMPRKFALKIDSTNCASIFSNFAAGAYESVGVEHECRAQTRRRQL